MNVQDILRVVSGIFAIVGTIVLIIGIATGRWRFGYQSAMRAGDPGVYWLLVARYACLVLGMALAATVAPEHAIGPVIGLSMFGPALVVALITGRFEWEADNKRIDRPARFWGWVAFYALLSLLMGVIVIMETISPTAP
jgi:hypothetical protein